MKPKKDNVVLIGMPAVGKSTVGILLAKKLGLDFVDTDITIQTKEGTTLSKIIDSIGVNAFLGLEEKYCLALTCTHHVIATGGSAVYSSWAMAHLALNAWIVYLEIGLDALKTRLSALDSRGVIRGPGQDIDSLYRERIPLYEKYADIRIQCEALSPDQVLTRIANALPENSRRWPHKEYDR